jgi:hypothetical protein
MAASAPKVPTLLIDAAVLIMDARWQDYYQHHVIPHEVRALQQDQLPAIKRDAFWFMRWELDPEASVLWALTH